MIRSRLRMASSTCSRPLTRAFSPSRVSRRRTFGRSRRTRSIQRSWRRLPKAITDYEVVVLRSADWTPHVSGTDLGGTCARCGNEVNGEGETPRLDGSLYSLRRPSRREQFEAPYDRSSADARPSRRRWRCPGPFSSGYPPLYSRSPVSSFPPPCSRSPVSSFPIRSDSHVVDTSSAVGLPTNAYRWSRPRARPNPPGAYPPPCAPSRTRRAGATCS